MAPLRRGLSLVHLYPNFLGSYGHRGNALILAQRCRWRGIACALREVPIAAEIPSDGDIYLLAGGEGAALATVAEALRQQPGLHRAAERGAVVLGVGSGLPLLGERLQLPSGETITGAGLLNLESHSGPKRCVGPVVGEPLLPIEAPWLGFEDHHLLIERGPEVQAIAQLRRGRQEGAWRANVFGTALRGPVLALNPAFADLLLEQRLGPLPPLPLLAVERLRARFLRGLHG